MFIQNLSQTHIWGPPAYVFEVSLSDDDACASWSLRHDVFFPIIREIIQKYKEGNQIYKNGK